MWEPARAVDGEREDDEVRENGEDPPGKILRQVLRKMIDGQPYQVPSTIDDPGILPEIEAILRERSVL